MRRRRAVVVIRLLGNGNDISMAVAAWRWPFLLHVPAVLFHAHVSALLPCIYAHASSPSSSYPSRTSADLLICVGAPCTTPM